MAAELEKQVERLLRQGDGKEKIYQRLEREENRSALIFHLNNLSLPRDRRKYQVLNLVLATLLLFVTSKKLIAAFAFGVLDLWLLLMLVVPIINLFVLRQILRFRRLGYQFLFVLSLLALLQPENHHPQEALLLALMSGLSGFLYLRLFPRQRMLRPREA
jgi:hypothetical protein